MELSSAHIRDRIKALRELRGWNQSEFAAVTGMSQAMISSLETGSRTATLDHAHYIAASTGTPDAFFLLSPEEPTDEELHFRKKKTAKITATRTLVRKYKESRTVARELVRDYAPPVQLSPVDGLVEDGDLEDIAIDIRVAMGLGPSEPVRNIIRACERAGFPVNPIAPVPGAESDHSGLSYTSASDGFGSISFLTGQSGDHQRMTVGHELSHRVLHFHRRVPERQRESEAFRLAGAIFLPRHSAMQELAESLSLTGYMRLKARWGISIQALIMRAGDLGVIDRDRKTSLMQQISRRGWRKAEPVAVGHERPALLWHLLERRFGSDPHRAATAELGHAREDLIEWIPREESAFRGPIVTSSNVVDLTHRFGRPRH